jgi:hypothetical protein
LTRPGRLDTIIFMLQYSLTRSNREIILPSLYDPLSINIQKFFSPQGQQATQDTDREFLQALLSPESKTSLNSEEEFYCNLLGLDQKEQDQLLELMKNPIDLFGAVPNFSQMEEPEIPQHSPYLKAIARFLTNRYHNSYTANERAIQLFRIAMSFYELEAAKNIAIYSTNSPANFPLYSRENFALISPENLDQLYAFMRDDFFKSIIECPYQIISPPNEYGFDCSPQQSKEIIEAAIKKIRAFAKILSEDPDEFLVKVSQGANLDRTTSASYTEEEKLRLSNHFANLENAPDEMFKFIAKTGFGKYYYRIFK